MRVTLQSRKRSKYNIYYKKVKPYKFSRNNLTRHIFTNEHPRRKLGSKIMEDNKLISFDLFNSTVEKCILQFLTIILNHSYMAHPDDGLESLFSFNNNTSKILDLLPN